VKTSDEIYSLAEIEKVIEEGATFMPIVTSEPTLPELREAAFTLG